MKNKLKSILLIEDGSVETNELDKLGIAYIVYRQGSVKPEWLCAKKKKEKIR